MFYLMVDGFLLYREYNPLISTKLRPETWDASGLSNWLLLERGPVLEQSVNYETY